MTLESAKQKASGKLAVYVTSTDSAATLTVTANPFAGSPIDLGSMTKTDPNGNEFFVIKKGLVPVSSVQITSTSRGSITAIVKAH